jgi:SAM-dependent methyltransferase
MSDAVGVVAGAALPGRALGHSPPPAEATQKRGAPIAWKRSRRCRPSRIERRDTEMSGNAGANAAQQEYWNTIAGPRWVGLEGFVERRVRGVNDLLLRHSAVTAGERVLEIGCGTGAFTVPLAEAVGERGQVVGADISDAMLAGARKRIAESGLHNVSLMQADAQTHGFDPGRFDLIASRFGVMFFSDPAAAFTNLLPAARPDGRLCFACWGSLADNRHWLIPYEVILRHLGPPEPKPARAPGPMAFADPDYVRAFLGVAGFEAIEVRRETPGIFASSPQEEAEHACIMGPSARLIDEKNPDEATRQMIQREIEEAFAAHAKAGGMVLPSTVFLVTARRPR